jgi:prolycopene isomerase
MHYIKGGAFRVRGGIQRLSDVIGAALKDCAGELCLGEEVISIYSNGRQAVGVVTKNGRKVQAEHIISNIDVKSAIRMMKGGLSQEEKLSRVKGLEVSGSFVLVYLGVKDDLHSYDLASSTGYFSSYGLNEMLNRNGQFFYGVSFSSLYDSSLAPLGCDNLVIHCPFCYNEARAEIPKDKIGIALIERLCEIMPSLTEKIVYKSVAGPCTLERRTGNAFGAAYGWKQDLNFLKNLPLLRNLLKNFHIVGHWAGYGGGVMPSMLSAYKVVRDIVKQEALL